MTYQRTRQTPKTPPRSGMFATGSMVHGYREVLSPHMIVVMITTAAVVVVAFSLVGPVGNLPCREPVGAHRVRGALCIPLLAYLLRASGGSAILSPLPEADRDSGRSSFVMLLGSFQCSAVIHTIESLSAGVSNRGGVCSVIFAGRHLGTVLLLLGNASDTARRSPYPRIPGVTRRQRHVTRHEAEASEGEDLNGKEPSNPGDVSPTVAVQDESADSRGHPNRRGAGGGAGQSRATACLPPRRPARSSPETAA